jgi:hypothetical protein
MASQVISFRLGEEALAKLEEKSKEGESPSQTAQRLLNDLLGTTKEIELTAVDSRIQEAIAPIRGELAELRALLTANKEQIKADKGIDEELSLTQAELAARLGCNPATIKRQLSKEDFAAWSCLNDPQGLGWRFIKEERRFVPNEGQSQKKFQAA